MSDLTPERLDEIRRNFKFYSQLLAPTYLDQCAGQDGGDLLAEVGRLNAVIKERDQDARDWHQTALVRANELRDLREVIKGLDSTIAELSKPRRDMTLTALAHRTLASAIYEAIKHGDEAHREWLHNALEGFLDSYWRNVVGRPSPEAEDIASWSREGQGETAEMSEKELAAHFQAHRGDVSTWAKHSTPTEPPAAPDWPPDCAHGYREGIGCEECHRPPAAPDLAALRKSAALAFREVMFVDRPPLLSHYYDFVDKQAAYSAALREKK